MKRLSRLFIVVASLGLVVACSSSAPPASSAGGEGAPAPSPVLDADKQWTMQNKNASSTRYSTVNEINTENVKNLKVAWSFSTGVLRGHEGEPLVIDNVMYVHTPFPNIVYALDLTQGGRAGEVEVRAEAGSRRHPDRLLRHGQSRRRVCRRQDLPESARHATPWRSMRRRGRNCGRSSRATTRTARPSPSAPMVIKDKVISGISGGEFGVRGFVTANDVNTGKQIWRMYSTGPEAEVGFPGSVETWEGDEWKRGGGTTWGWYSYDPDLNLFYYGTGNPGSWNPDQRPGDNKWSMTIFARNPGYRKSGVGVSEDAA